MADISFEVEANKVHISSEEKLGIYFCHSNLIISVMPEGEKHWGGTTVIINPNEYFEIKKRIMSKEYDFCIPQFVDFF